MRSYLAESSTSRPAAGPPRGRRRTAPENETLPARVYARKAGEGSGGERRHRAGKAAPPPWGSGPGQPLRARRRPPPPRAAWNRRVPRPRCGRTALPAAWPPREDGESGRGPARAPPPQSTAAPAAPGPSPTRRVRHSHVTRRPRRRAPRSASRGRRCPLVPAGSCSSSATPGPPRRRPEPAATRTAAPAACGGGNVNKWGFIATSLECRVHLPLRSVPNRRGASSSSCSSCRCRRYAIRQPLLRQPPARSPHSPLRTVRIASPQPARPNAEPFPPLPPRLASPSPTPPPATKMA